MERILSLNFVCINFGGSIRACEVLSASCLTTLDVAVGCSYVLYVYSAPFGPQPRSCVKVEVAVLGSPSLIVLMVSVDVKKH